MTWDIAAARARIGLVVGDTTKDVELTSAMDAALAIAESYCDRLFLDAAEVEIFVDSTAKHFQLKRFPITTINSITGDSVGAYDVDKKHGWLNIHVAYRRTLTVDYQAGYVVLPGDLELALWQVFDSAHGLSTSAGGGVSGGIKKIAVTGVGAIDYDTGASAATTSSALIPAAALNILDAYRLESA